MLYNAHLLVLVVLTVNSFKVHGIFIVKIGILYDSSTSQLASLVHDTITQLSKSDITYKASKILQTQHSNLTETLLDLEVAAVLSVATKLDCAKVQKVKILLPIFSVAKSLDSCNRNEAHNSITYLFPPNFALISALVATAKKYKWTKAIVLEKQSDEIFFSFTDIQYTREQGIDTLAFEANGDEASLIRSLKVARKEGVRAYILTSSTLKAKEILRTAERMRLTTENFHWFLPNVFYDPDAFSELAKSGVKMSFLSSPVITPLVRELMKNYTDSSNTSDEQLLYNDVIRALVRLAVDKVTTSCISRACVRAVGVCRPLSPDVDFRILETSQESDNSSRQRRDVMQSSPLAPSSVACDRSSVTAYTCRKMSTLVLRGSKNGEIKRRYQLKSTENKHNRKTERLHGKTSGMQRTRRAAAAIELPSSTCNMLQWPKGIAQVEYKSLAGNCSSRTPYRWAYKEESCSRHFVQAVEVSAANSIIISEYVQQDLLPTPEPSVVVVGTFEWNRLALNVTYRPFSVNDLKLARRVQQACAIWHPPWLSWKNDKKNGERVFEGYLVDVVQQLSISMNFTYEIVIHPHFEKKSTPSEAELERMMYAMFENDSCDFFLHAKGVRGNRLGKAELVDFSLAYQQPSMFILTKRSEKTETIDIWQFMTPFLEESWIYLWSCYVLVSLFLAFINYQNPYEYAKIATSFGPDSVPGDHLGVLNSLWFTFSSIVQQGVALVPRSRAAKVLTAFWWFFGLTIITAYTANMTLFMTQVNKGGIKTLDELANQKEYDYGIMYNNPMLNLALPDAKERPYSQLYNHFKKEWNKTVFHHHKEAFDKILSGDFFLLSSFETVVEALTQSCKFDKVGSGFYKYQFALPFPKGSLAIPLFNDHIARLRDRGVLASMEDKWFSLEAECENSNTPKTLENQLDIKAFTGMYVFLIIGCSIGCIICVIEIGWVRFGGIGGMFGKAKQYEFKENRRENRRGLDQLATEFEKWEGGWEVWKFKEWAADAHSKAMTSPDKSKRLIMEQKIRELTQKDAHPACCLCGKIIRPRRGDKAAYRCDIIRRSSDPERTAKEENEGADSGRCSVASVEEEITLSPNNNEGSNVILTSVLPLSSRCDNSRDQEFDKVPQDFPPAEPDIPTDRFIPEGRQSLRSTLSHSSLASGTISVVTSCTSHWTTSHLSRTPGFGSSDENPGTNRGTGFGPVPAPLPPIEFSRRSSFDDVSMDEDEDEWTEDDELTDVEEAEARFASVG